jgi:Tol biopolymer transport system component
MNVVGVSVADGAELPLTSQRWAEVGDVAWLPDGSHLVVVGNEKPASPAQVWLLAYPEGRARQVTNDLNAYGWVGVTADSETLLLVQRNSMSGLWVADAGQKEGEARQIGSEAGGYGDLSWTPDGRVVYRSRAGGDPNLWIVDAGGTNPRQLTTGASIWPSFAVTPDGRHVVFASPRGGKINLWRVGLDGGGLEQLTDGEGEVFPTVSPDSRWVVYQSGVSTGKPTVRKVPIEGGPSLPAIETFAMRPEVSPDGKYVAYFYMEEAERAGTQWRIGVASLEDGSLVKFFRIAATARVRRVRWTPDGEALTYVNTVGGAANVWRQPFAGGAPRRITNFGAGQIETFAWSPAGKYLAVERPTLISDVALLSDFR